MHHQIPPKYNKVMLCYGEVMVTLPENKCQIQYCRFIFGRQTRWASQGQFPLFCMPEAPSHTVNQEACVTDSLFSSHKHGTPLETAQPLFHCPLSSLLHKALRLRAANHCVQTKLPRCRFSEDIRVWQVLSGTLSVEIKLVRKKWPSIMYERKNYPQKVSHPWNWIQNLRGELWDWCICTLCL